MEPKNDILNKARDDIINNIKTVNQIAIENSSFYHQYYRLLNKIEDLVLRKKFRTEMT